MHLLRRSGKVCKGLSKISLRSWATEESLIYRLFSGTHTETYTECCWKINSVKNTCRSAQTRRREHMLSDAWKRCSQHKVFARKDYNLKSCCNWTLRGRALFHLKGRLFKEATWVALVFWTDNVYEVTEIQRTKKWYKITRGIDTVNGQSFTESWGIQNQTTLL